jgi:hypothetical protein
VTLIVLTILLILGVGTALVTRTPEPVAETKTQTT